MEEVPKLVVEVLVAVVGDGEQAVFDAKGVGVVVAGFMVADFGGPATEVAPVEKRGPIAVASAFGFSRPSTFGPRNHAESREANSDQAWLAHA